MVFSTMPIVVLQELEFQVSYVIDRSVYLSDFICSRKYSVKKSTRSVAQVFRNHLAKLPAGRSGVRHVCLVRSATTED